MGLPAYCRQPRSVWIALVVGHVQSVARLRFGEETIELDEPVLRALYEELWRVAGEQRGAVTAAARLRHAIAYASERPRLLAFENQEAIAVRAALDRINHA